MYRKSRFHIHVTIIIYMATFSGGALIQVSNIGSIRLIISSWLSRASAIGAEMLK